MKVSFIFFGLQIAKLLFIHPQLWETRQEKNCNQSEDGAAEDHLVRSLLVSPKQLLTVMFTLQSYTVLNSIYVPRIACHFYNRTRKSQVQVHVSKYRQTLQDSHQRLIILKNFANITRRNFFSNRFLKGNQSQV